MKEESWPGGEAEWRFTRFVYIFLETKNLFSSFPKFYISSGLVPADIGNLLFANSR